MNTIVVSAKTLDGAITKALTELGTTSDNSDYIVIDEGNAGLLGIIGAKPVKISTRKKRELSTLGGFLGKDQEAKKQQEATKREAKAAQKAARLVRKKPAKLVRESKLAKEEEVCEEEKVVEEKKAAPIEDQEKPVVSSKKSVDGTVYEETAKKFLMQMFAAADMKVKIIASYYEDNKELYVDMFGADMGILIGKKGQTLDSLQYLVNLVMNKDCDGYVRVKLDTENYRARRKGALETLIKNIVYRVKRTRHSISLEPTNPYERRIIHSALQNNKFMIARDEGGEPFRHVVVSLKKESRENKSKNN